MGQVGFNPGSKPDYEHYPLTFARKVLCLVWVKHLADLGVIEHVDEFFFIRGLERGFRSDREQGQILMKAQRAGVDLLFDLRKALRDPDATLESLRCSHSKVGSDPV